MSNARVAILMGSDSDYDTMEHAVKVLREFNISFEVQVSSAHRTPERTAEYAKTARERGIQCFIIGAGAAAHLAGVVAAHSTLPVIGVPIDATSLRGVDALYSTVMMPGGIPVASMAIGNAGAMNAALFVVAMFSTTDEKIADQLAEYRRKMVEKVTAKSQALQARINNPGQA